MRSNSDNERVAGQDTARDSRVFRPIGQIIFNLVIKNVSLLNMGSMG